MSSNDYMSVYMKRRYHQRRAHAIALLGGRCVVCGQTDGLEIDHINPADKTMELAKAWSTSSQRYYGEVAKCQLLCRRHHHAKSAAERGVPHGGGLSGKRNCPCQPCRTRKAEYNRHYKAAKAELQQPADASPSPEGAPAPRRRVSTP